MQLDSGETTFDLQDTRVIDLHTGSGGAFTATMYNSKFVIDDRLMADSVTADDDFGKGDCVIDNTVLVGAPQDEGNNKVNEDTATIKENKIESLKLNNCQE